MVYKRFLIVFAAVFSALLTGILGVARAEVETIWYAPSYEQTVNGTIKVYVSVPADSKKVEYYLDGKFYSNPPLISAENTSSNGAALYGFEWNTTKVSNGIHYWEAKVTDGKGVVGYAKTVESQGSSKQLVVTVANNSQTASGTWAAPQNNQEVSGKITITAKTKGSLKKIEFYLDGKYHKTAYAAPGNTASNFSLDWDSAQVANGLHYWEAKLTDDQGAIAYVQTTEENTRLMVVTKNDKTSEVQASCSEKITEIYAINQSLINRVEGRLDLLDELSKEVDQFYLTSGKKINGYDEARNKIEQKRTESESALVNLGLNQLIACDVPLKSQVESYKTAITAAQSANKAYQSAILDLIKLILAGS